MTSRRLDDDAIAAALPRLSGWRRVGDALVKVTTHPTFMAGIAFVGTVADVAERFDHHPDIAIAFRTVTLTLTTHDAAGLTDLDLDVAAAIDLLGPTTLH